MILTQLIAFGIFAGSGGGGGGEIGPITTVGEVVASSDCTAIVPSVQTASLTSAAAPLGSQAWRRHFDPADHAPYALDFGPLLEASENIAVIESIVMSATAALLGVGIDTAGAYAPIIDTDGEKVQLWFVVDEDAWDALSFEASGVQLPVTVRVTTDSTPPKRYERSGVLTVRQQ
jgi:hypothetical protein